MPDDGERLEIVKNEDYLEVLIIEDIDYAEGESFNIRRSYHIPKGYGGEDMDDMDSVMVVTDPGDDDERLNMTDTDHEDERIGFTDAELIDRISGVSGDGPWTVNSGPMKMIIESDYIEDDPNCVWIEEGYDESVKGVILKCDEESQQILFYEYEDDKCSGDPMDSEPSVYMDKSDDPCSKIICSMN